MDGNRLIIDYPSLPNDNDFKAEQMALAWSFNLRKKEIYISVDFQKPSWKLDSNQNFNEEKLKKVFKGKKGGLKYFFDLTVTNGKASWTLPDQSMHQVHFDAKTSSKSGGYNKKSPQQAAGYFGFCFSRTTLAVPQKDPLFSYTISYTLDLHDLVFLHSWQSCFRLHVCQPN